MVSPPPVALLEQALEYHLRVGDALAQEVVDQAGMSGEDGRTRSLPGVPMGKRP